MVEVREVVCEGIPDALTAAQAGHISVGILGSRAPDHSVAARIASYADHHRLDVVAVIDNDPAGRAWGNDSVTSSPTTSSP